ncbi:MAG: FRG domain-containing protein [Victivallaceae bacterium]|jgi:hypothetical protein
MCKIIEIKSLEEYIDGIVGFSDVLFYRGLSNISYELIPSAGRFGIKDEKVQKQFERTLFNDFKRKAPIYNEKTPINDLEWLILAQHHGIPTRLMDWSFNPMVALFFAVENNHDVDSCVYESFLSNGLTNITSLDAIFGKEKFAPIIPNFTNIRYRNQESLFTLHKSPSIPDYSNISKKFIINKKVKQIIRWKLRRIGITKSFIYPGLDSLAYDILETHKLSFKDYLCQT